MHEIEKFLLRHRSFDLYTCELDEALETPVPGRTHIDLTSRVFLTGARHSRIRVLLESW
jgi:hypothetical protein